MRWWGWGDPNHASGLPAGALAFLAGSVGIASRPRPPVALGAVGLNPPSIREPALAAIRQAVGERGVRVDHGERVCHAAGKGYPDLVRMRAGEPQGGPDAVVHPGSRGELEAVLAACAKHSIAVVPFGGGTSVVGGVAPLRGDHAGVVALDMDRMDRVLDLDRRSRLVTVQGGMLARELERALAGEGLTLGHHPQSFEYVSLGGCAATRSAGQASTGYGRFERMVAGVGLVAPAGAIDLPVVPASAAGPSLREAIVGSEGMLGVIDRLTLRVRPAPGERLYEGVFFESFAAGMEALRELAQERAAPDVARLSDEPETRMSLALAGAGDASASRHTARRPGGDAAKAPHGDAAKAPLANAAKAHGDPAKAPLANVAKAIKTRAGLAYLRARGYGEGCLAIFGFEDQPGRARSRQRRARAMVRAQGGLPVGSSPGEAWLASRFAGPYLRDELLTHGVMVETLETATTWSNLASLHTRVASAISAALEQWGTPPLVMCHVSHLYETGASLYFTFLARQSEGREIEQWRSVKRAAAGAILDGGGTITHHHAIGRDHAPWLEREIGRQGVAALRALKSELDPAGIMNPGKLLL